MDLDHDLDDGWFPAAQVRSDLGGDMRTRVADQHAWGSPLRSLLVEQRLHAVRYAAWCPVSNEMLADARMVRGLVERAIDRHLRPWLFPDRNPMPMFDLFPRLSRLFRWSRPRG